MLSGARGKAGDPNALPLPRLPRFSGIREVTKSTSGREETTLQRGPGSTNARQNKREGNEPSPFKCPEGAPTRRDLSTCNFQTFPWADEGVFKKAKGPEVSFRTVKFRRRGIIGNLTGPRNRTRGLAWL